MTVNKAESNANNYINNNKQVENKEKTTNQAKQLQTRVEVNCANHDVVQTST